MKRSISSEAASSNVDSIVRWMLHHWMDARAIDFTLMDLPAETIFLLPSLKTQQQEARLDAHVPAALRVFRGAFFHNFVWHDIMMAKERQDCMESVGGGTRYTSSEGPVERLCTHLLSLMDRLTALNLFTATAPQLPSFKELEHLELHSMNLEGVEQSLIGLHSLKTLFLSCEHLEALLPELRMEGLSKLRHVRLDDVFPAELSLPPDCRLDVKGEAIVMDKVISAAWRDALKHLHACTCRWTMRKDKPRSLIVTRLPTFLSLAAGCIQELSLVATQPLIHQVVYVTFGLDPAIFCNLKQLRLKTNWHFKIHVPAAVRLASLQVHAYILTLTFEDAKGDACELREHMDIYHGAPQSCSCTMCWECMRR
ncbi:hypothetical protein COCOBI_19-0080 [Coccomyxa sp. Obi]|nr:hypothetical protein COCOBI_19-0080 [Coccomyxa sp. Obi]